MINKEILVNSRHIVGGYILLSLLLICYLPTLFPGTFVGADSYVFGYNNRVGFALVLVLTAVAAIYFRKADLQLFTTSAAASVIRPASFWICMSSAIVVGLWMYLITSRLGSYGEATYFINRIELVSRGRVPYQDFEFCYGPFFLYGPLVISRLFGASLPNSYYLFWILNACLGTWFLREIINRIDYPGQYRNEIFKWLFAFTLLSMLCVGTNYTTFRFLLDPLLAILTFRVMRNGNLGSQINAAILAPVFALFALLVSPDMGIAYILGISAFMLIFNAQSKEKLWMLPFLGMLLLFALLLTVANGFQLFSTMKSIGGGGLNFPIIPAPAVLFYFFVLFLCTQLLIFSLVGGETRSNHICVLLVSFPLVASALGRCDPGHLFFNGLIFILIGFFWSSGSPRAWAWYRRLYALVFIVFGTVSAGWLYTNELARASIYTAMPAIARSDWAIGTVTKLLALHFGEAAVRNKFEIIKRSAQQDASKDAVVLPSGIREITEVPFGYQSQNPTSLDFGYFLGLDNVLDPQAVDKKIAELRRASDRQLLLPEKWETNCSVNPEKSKRLIRFLFVYPYSARAVHTQSIYQPLCGYIQTNYELETPPGPETFGYEIWTPRRRS